MRIDPIQVLCLCFIALSVCQGFDIAEADFQKQLSLKWEKWLNEEVVHIISTREREIFLQLTTEEQRELFSKMFWEIRDPTPGTEQNEFLEEHRRRIDYADRMFGYDSPGRGALTERGRIYISLGPPRSVESYPSGANTHPMELWFYEADPRKGVPAYFYLLFFKRFGIGDYILYNPVADGPSSLVATLNPRVSAFDILENVDSVLARAAINLVPSDVGGSDFKPSLYSLVLLDKIDRIKDVGIDASYAEKILLGIETVTTEYYFRTDQLAMVAFPSVEERGFSFIDVSIELLPEQVNLGRHENKIYGAFKLDYHIGNTDGATLHTESETLEIEFPASEFDLHKSQPLLFEKRLPCVPGQHNLNVTLRNEVSREQFFLSKTIDIPASNSNSFSASTLLFARGLERLDTVRLDKIKPLQFADVTLAGNPRALYSPQTQLLGYCQLFLPDAMKFEAPEEVVVGYSVVTPDGEEKLSGKQSIQKDLFSTNGIFHFFFRWPLDGFEPGRYTVILQINPGSGHSTLVRMADFFVEGRIIHEPIEAKGKDINLASAEFLLALGRMWLSVGNDEQAMQLLLASFNVKPDCYDCALELAELLLKTDKSGEALRVLESLTAGRPNDAAVLRLVGLGYYNSEEFGKATKFFIRLIAEEGETTDILNLLGKSYYHSGRLEEAVETWRKSLEIDPAQESIKALLQEAQRERQ